MSLNRKIYEFKVVSITECCSIYGWVFQPEGKRQLGRPRHQWEDNIKMDLQELGCGGMYWIGLAQDGDRWRTLVNVAMNLRAPQNARNFLTN
jgi:hypothetical protein